MVEKDSGSIGGKVVASVLVTVAILAGATFLFHSYIIPVWELDGQLLYTLSLRIFPILIGVVLFLLGAVVAATHTRADRGDEDDFFERDPYSDPLYRLPDGQREEILPDVSLLFEEVEASTPVASELEETSWPQEIAPATTETEELTSSWAELVEQEREGVHSSKAPPIIPPVEPAVEADSFEESVLAPETTPPVAVAMTGEEPVERQEPAPPITSETLTESVVTVDDVAITAEEPAGDEELSPPMATVPVTESVATVDGSGDERATIASPEASRVEGVSWADTEVITELDAFEPWFEQPEAPKSPMLSRVTPMVSIPKEEPREVPVATTTESSIPSRLPTIVDSLVTRLDAELSSARQFEYDLSLVTFNRDDEASVVKVLEAELDEVAFLYSDDESITSILPFYSFNRTKRFLARSLESARKQHAVSRFALGFSSLGGRDLSADELLKESQMALNLADDQGGLSLIGFEAESTTLR